MVPGPLRPPVARERPVADHPARRPRLRRRLLLVPVYLAFLIALVEGASYATLWKLQGTAPTRARLRALQTELAGGGTERGEREPRGPAFLEDQILHPYMGFVPRDSSHMAAPDLAWLNQGRLFAAGSPIYSDDPDTVVVGITGGSVANHFAQRGRGALAGELAKHHRFAGKSFRFVGMAHGGFKQPQQLMALAYLLSLGGRLDVLVNVDGFNEVALHAVDNGMQGVSPVYPRAWYFRTYGPEIEGPILGELDHLRRRRAELAGDALLSRWRTSWTFELVWVLRERALARRARAVEDELRAFRPSSDVRRLGPRIEREGGDLAVLVDVWRDSSLQLARLCRANGIAYFHFLQPNQYVEGSKPFSPEELETAYDAESRYAPQVHAGYPALRAAGVELAEAGVPFHDLTLVFAEVEETVYDDPCCHLNERGHELLASAIAAFVLSWTE